MNRKKVGLTKICNNVNSSFLFLFCLIVIGLHSVYCFTFCHKINKYKTQVGNCLYTKINLKQKCT